MVVLAARRLRTHDRVVRHVVLVTFPGLQPLDVTGPAEVFRMAGTYDVTVAAARDEPVDTGAGYSLTPARTLREVDDLHVDTLLVAGGQGTRDALVQAQIAPWLRRTAPRVRRVGSVCSGAFLLGAAGLLDGRRATTHWRWCDLLQELHPQATIDPEPIFVADGPLRTSAGVTAGMDLALALVEEDHGPAKALEIARELVLFVKRPGGQSQFSAHLAAQTADRRPLRELQAWMADHLADDLTVPALAARAQMSERTFARAFRREVGQTPAAYVEQLRVQRARLQLETTATPTEAIAVQCGFGTVETLRRAFARRVGVSPGAYRDRFAS